MITEEYRRIRGLLDSIGEKFRQADKYFSELELEDKAMLNKAGKIIEWISHLLMIYEHANEDRKREIRRIFGIVEEYIKVMTEG